MADEEDPWGFDDAAEETTTEPSKETSQPEPSTVQTDAAAPAQTENKENVVEDSAPPPPPPPEDDGYRKPVQLYRHWVRYLRTHVYRFEILLKECDIFIFRPKFLQYKYMYNYRTNYYDDVIDYLDKKQIGVPRDIPRAQTWAERVLRTSPCR